MSIGSFDLCISRDFAKEDIDEYIPDLKRNFRYREFKCLNDKFI